MTIHYVDQSLAENGDGTAHTLAAGAGLTGAWNVFTATEEANVLVDDIVYFRRTPAGDETTIVIADDGTAYATPVFMYGWPKSTDDNFAARPSPPRATWDGDAADYCFVANTSALKFANIYFWRFATEASGAVSQNMFNFLNDSDDMNLRHLEVSGGANGGLIFGTNISGAADQPAGTVRILDVHLRTGTTSGTGTLHASVKTGGNYAFRELQITFRGTTGDFAVKFGEGGASGITNAVTPIVYVQITDVTGSTSAMRVNVDTEDSYGHFICEYDDGAQGVSATLGDVKLTGGTIGGTHAYVLLRNWESTGDKTFAVDIDSGNHLHAENCKFAGSSEDIRISINSHFTGRDVTFDRTKVAKSTESQANGINFGRPMGRVNGTIAIEDFGGTAGKYLRMGPTLTLESVGADRDGSNATGSALMLLEGWLGKHIIEDLDDPLGGNIGFALFQSDVSPFDLLFVKVTAVLTTIDVFVFIKDWDGNEDLSKVWLELDVPKAGGGYERRSLYDRTGAALSTGGGTWTGVTGGIAYQFSDTFTPGAAGPLKARIVCGETHQTGGGDRPSIYIDPILVKS